MIQEIRDFLLKADILLVNIQKLFIGDTLIKTFSCGNIMISKEIIKKVNRTEGSKIPRIKLMRKLVDCGLKEAKEIVEKVWDSNGSGSVKRKYL